ncbi:MAG TPA: phosphoenolpyruvate carboxykinase domain-containing protein, partial [Propionicimonas sp.]
MQGLNIDGDSIEALFGQDRDAWMKEVQSMQTWLDQFGDRLPKTLAAQLDQLCLRVTDLSHPSRG